MHACPQPNRLRPLITPYPHPHPNPAQVKYHDIHHWFPESNYGQYIMLWDRLMGSFKPYPGTAKSA